MTADRGLEADISDLGVSRPEVAEAARERIQERGAVASPELLCALTEDRLGAVGRARVLRLLGSLALPETFEPVRGALTDERYHVRAAALTAVAAFPGPEAIAALIAALEDQDPDLARQAASHLADRPDPTAVLALARLLDHPSPSSRATAARALARIADPPALAALAARRVIERDAEVLAILDVAEAP